jgi:hypothetical protein
MRRIFLSNSQSFWEVAQVSVHLDCFITGKKPELAIKMYTDLGNFPEALRVAKKYAPHLVNEINNKYMGKAGT